MGQKRKSSRAFMVCVWSHEWAWGWHLCGLAVWRARVREAPQMHSTPATVALLHYVKPHAKRRRRRHRRRCFCVRPFFVGVCVWLQVYVYVWINGIMSLCIYMCEAVFGTWIEFAYTKRFIRIIDLKRFMGRFIVRFFSSSSSVACACGLLKGAGNVCGRRTENLLLYERAICVRNGVY